MKSTFKHVLFLFPVLMMFFALTATSAIANSLSAQIQPQGMIIDPSLQWPGDLRGGQVVINTNNPEITLHLGTTHDCAGNVFCGAHSDGQIEFHVHLKTKTQNPCGAVIYKGETRENETLSTVTVIDNSNLRCFMLKPQTEIILEKSSEQPFLKSEVYFQATKLATTSVQK